MNARKICWGQIFSAERRARLRGWGGVKLPRLFVSKKTVSPQNLGRSAATSVETKARRGQDAGKTSAAKPPCPATAFRYPMANHAKGPPMPAAAAVTQIVTG